MSSLLTMVHSSHLTVRAVSYQLQCCQMLLRLIPEKLPHTPLSII
jgi:hypothetical protein